MRLRLQASLEPTPVGWLVGWSVTLSDFHSVSVSGPLQSVFRPRGVIFSKIYDQQLSDYFQSVLF